MIGWGREVELKRYFIGIQYNYNNELDLFVVPSGNGEWVKVNEAELETSARDNRIAELENQLSTEKEYSAELVQRSNRFADEIETANKRIAELEAALASVMDDRDGLESEPLDVDLRKEKVDSAFIARMEYELEQNNHKGAWDAWHPAHIELVVELLHHISKLTNALKSENKHLVAEYSADIANLAMKTHELFGK